MKRALLALALAFALAADRPWPDRLPLLEPQGCLSLLPLTEFPMPGGSWLAIEACLAPIPAPNALAHARTR
jgi:hypothetical protein